MQLTTRPVSAALAPFVASIWHFRSDLPDACERILPTGTAQLLVNLEQDELRTYDLDGGGLQRLRGACLSGVHTHPFAIDTAEQRHVLGVTFHPGGTFPFFAEPCSEVTGHHVELAALWGADGARLRERLLYARTPEAMLATMERVLLCRALRGLHVDRRLSFARDALEGGASVSFVTERVGMSPRKLIQWFEERVGISPKRFARVRRFQRLLHTVGAQRTPAWGHVAVAHGYFDQAHLIRDFREFAGLRPSAYRPRGDGFHHVPLED